MRELYVILEKNRGRSQKVAKHIQLASFTACCIFVEINESYLFDGRILK